MVAGISDAYRPRFHFTAGSGWLNDPNGLVYYDGEYHMFFQYHPSREPDDLKWWGHAVSSDLVHWEEIAPAIIPEDGTGVWSGSAVVDWENTSGLQTGAEKVLLALFTAYVDPVTQHLAYSNDRGRTWIRYGGNPVLGHIKGGNRDPKVFRHAPSAAWIMVLYIDGNDYALFSSPNALEWSRLSSLEFPGCWECPDIFELPVDGDPRDTRWVFIGGNGNYMIGDFDGARFVPEVGPIQADHGANYYATQTFSDIPASDGRRIQIAWMAGGHYLGMPFNQQMSFPCELALRRTSGGIRMFRTPFREIALLRRKTHQWRNVVLRPGDDPLAGVEGELFDISLEFESIDALEFGIRCHGQLVNYCALSRELSCLGRSSVLEPSPENRISVRILLDRTSIEVFGNDGEVVMSSCFLPGASDTGLRMCAVGGTARVVSLEVHELASALPELDTRRGA